MALRQLMCALVLGGTLAMATITPSTTTWAGADSYKLMGPMPPRETINRPECWLEDESLRHCSCSEKFRL
jgi:hypothetical protein